MVAEARILLVSAVASGQGKTTVTAALARALTRRGLRVRVFKCGADFIDPMLLERASEAPVGSLDLWMVGLDECRRQLAQATADADVVLIEGVMGLYDGTPSSADLARCFGMPVLAVIDASAMAQTAGALVLGLRDYGPVEMAGVIANRVAGPGHAKMVAASMRGIPLLATLPRQDKSLSERQLGLVLPAEQDDVDELLDKAGAELVIDDDVWAALRTTRIDTPPPNEPVAALLAGVVIAVARDAAFAFLYPANLATLRELGATLAFFSPLADEPVPTGANAVYLPGGYPELHAATLAQAVNWHASIRAAHASGMPIVAECGGMMAIAESLTDIDGNQWPMAGLISGHTAMQARLGGLGPQFLSTSQGQLRGHAFHYSVLKGGPSPAAHTTRHPNGGEGEAVYCSESLTASYFHAYFPSSPTAVAGLFLPASHEYLKESK